MKENDLLPSTVFSIAAEAMADNLVKNGEFKALDKKGVSVGWTVSTAKPAVSKQSAPGFGWRFSNFQSAGVRPFAPVFFEDIYLC